MSAPIITPALVRRYLKATGWTLGTDGWWTGTNERGEAGCGFPDAWITRDPYDADVLARTAGSLSRTLQLCARLGMLTAAEILFARAAKLEPSTSLDGSYDAAKKRIAEKREAEILRDEAERLVEHAGVDPKAWEAAR